MEAVRRVSIRWDVFAEVAAAFSCLVLLSFSAGVFAQSVSICATKNSDGTWVGCNEVDPALTTQIGSTVGAVKMIGLIPGSPTVQTQVPTNPTAGYPTPAGWTNPTAPSLLPIPPTAGGATGYCINNPSGTACLAGSSGGTQAAAVSAFDAVNSNFWYLVSNWNSVPGDAGMRACSYASAQGTPVAPCTGNNGVFDFRATCPAGYTNSGGACTLSNAAVVVKPADNNCGIIRVGNLYTLDPLDPDCAAGVTPYLSQAGGGLVIGSGLGAQTQSVSIAANGVATITKSGPDASGNTVQSTATVSAPAPGTGATTITGFGTNVTPGVGANNTPAATPADVVGCGAVGQVPCKIDETGTGTNSGTLTGATTALDGEKASGVAVIEALATSSKRTDLGITLGITWPSVTCTNPTTTIRGHSMSVDLCSHQSEVQTIMSWLVWVLGAFLAFGMISEIR